LGKKEGSPELDGFEKTTGKRKRFRKRKRGKREPPKKKGNVRNKPTGKGGKKRKYRAALSSPDNIEEEEAGTTGEGHWRPSLKSDS